MVYNTKDILIINNPNPIIGDKRTYKDNKGHCRNLLWVICPDCKKGRWVQLIKSKKSSFTGRCANCRSSILNSKLLGRVGEKSPNWRGGRYKDNLGYVKIRLEPGDKYYKMGRKHGNYSSYIPEHRLVMAQYLGRPLKSWEIVHHKDGIRDHNDIDNLELFDTRGKHIEAEYKAKKELRKQIMDLQSRVTLLEAEIIILKKEG